MPADPKAKEDDTGSGVTWFLGILKVIYILGIVAKRTLLVFTWVKV